MEVIFPQFVEFTASGTLIPADINDKNSSGDEIANVNFYAVLPEAARIR